ncbi:beta-propeller domain-containing protein [bacterium]|nr:beta-propeller domain-containing protein [bacterium]
MHINRSNKTPSLGCFIPRTTLIFAVTIGFLAGCGGGSSTPVAPPPPTSGLPPEPVAEGLLIRMTDSEQFKTYMSASIQTYANDQFQSRQAEPVFNDAPVAEDGLFAEFSTTYTLERNVDEYDIVKYNGTHIFIAPSGNLNCCFIVDDRLAADDAGLGSNPDTPADEGVGGSKNVIRVLKTDPASGMAETVHQIALDDDRNIEGLYLLDQELIALTSTAWWGWSGDLYDQAEQWRGDSLGLQIYTLAPDYTQQHQLRIEGALVNSRRTAAGLFLISRHTPDIEGVIYTPEDQGALDTTAEVLAQTDPAEFLPLIERDGVALEVLDYEQCYQLNPNDPDTPQGSSSPIITTILHVNPQTAEIISAACVIERVDGIYLTPNRMYLTTNIWTQDLQDTLIHQFDLGQQIKYDGSARLSGSLFLNDNLDFRINEFEGNLRVVLSQWTNQESDRVDHSLYILQPASERPALEVIGQLPNPEYPEELGKPNEDLYGVRFLNERAYLVTFEQTDPLYVIDLADSSNPRIAGQLEVPGVSDFLHTVSDNVLFGLGQLDNHVKLELFDVSDINAPRSLSSKLLDESLSFSASQAQWNRRAFTYLRINDQTHRMAIPVIGTLEDSAQSEARLYLFDISAPNIPNAVALSSTGYMMAGENDGLAIWGEQRSILDGNAVYWALDQDLISAFWSNPTQTSIAH